MNANLRIEAPLHSLEPIDWLMYCDLLQDGGGSPRRAREARRIGESLQRGKALVLVLHCPEQQLKGHWLQVGRTWFIPVSGTLVSYCNDMQWWRPEWIRSGFARYRHKDRTDPEGMIRYASGTPFEHDYADFSSTVGKFGHRVTQRFFETHGRVRLPRAWV
jgi:hypothetical protein